jgi:hypothetical protein
LKHAPRHPNHPSVVADLDPELHGLPLGIPAGVLRERRLGNRSPPAILFGGRADEEHAPRGGPGQMTNWKKHLADEVIE